MAPMTEELWSSEPKEEFDDYEEELEEVVVSEDDVSYIEEIIESDDEEIDEETIIEEVVEDSDDDDDEEESGSGEYLDDSSAPPPSIDSDSPDMYDDSAPDLGRSFREDAGVDLLTKRRADMQLEMQNAAVSEGARKAMEEQLAREISIQRQAAKDALQRKRLEQEAAIRHAEGRAAQSNQDVEQEQEQHEDPERRQQDSILERQKKQDEAARRRLVEEIRKVDLALSKKRDTVAKTRIHGTAEVEKRKKALAELRRQAAREELARNNVKLKAAKASRGGTSMASTTGASANSVVSFRPTSTPHQNQISPPSPTESAPGILAQTRVRDSIESVVVPSVQDPISPLPVKGLDSLRRSRLPSKPPLLYDENNSHGQTAADEENVSSKSQHSKASSDSGRGANPVREEASAVQTTKTSSISSQDFITSNGGPERPEDQKPIPDAAPPNSPPPQEKPAPSVFNKEANPMPAPSTFQASEIARPAIEETREPSKPANSLEGEFYALEDLQEQRVKGIDYARREQYLSPKNFQVCFKMNSDEFAKMPKWKRDKAKRGLKLF